MDFCYVVKGVLAVSGRPRTSGEGDDLSAFVRGGFAGVVSLTRSSLSPDALARAELEYLHLPVDDFAAPSLETVRRFVDFVRRVSARGAVLAHCSSGYGRSGTMAACYLVSEGRTAEEAIREVRRLRPGSVETDEQEEAVRAWADSERNASLRNPP